MVLRSKKLLFLVYIYLSGPSLQKGGISQTRDFSSDLGSLACPLSVLCPLCLIVIVFSFCPHVMFTTGNGVLFHFVSNVPLHVLLPHKQA